MLIEEAVAKVPRVHFETPEHLPTADDASAFPLPEAQPIPALQVVSRMTAALRLKPTARVLHVGTGTGYIAAVLGHLAGEVHTVERIASRAELARRRFQALGYRNIHVKTGDGTRGWPEHAPFDAVLVSASAARVPKPLLDQLKVGGILVMPLGSPVHSQRLVRVTRTGAAQWKEERLGEIDTVQRLGDILVTLGVTERRAVERAAARRPAAKDGLRLGASLLADKQVSEVDLYRALAIQRHLPFSTADDLVKRFNPTLLRAASRPFLEHNRILPIAREEDVILVAAANPAAMELDLNKIFHPSSIRYCLVTPTDYQRLWRTIDLMTAKQKLPAVRDADMGEDLLESSLDRHSAHFISILDSLLLDAMANRASDIHLERYGNRVRVRLRVDGDLRDIEHYKLTPVELIGVVNVVKIRATLDIAERRLPQGGRIFMRVGAHRFDLRVQTQPSLHGEHVVIRFLPQDERLLTIEELGFPEEVKNRYRRLLDHPSGLVLVVGPTGTGKTTTLYAGLQILAKDPTRKVISVEDPIEYTLDNVQQTQTRPEIGFQFADAMRAFVREDPDVIFVGEIRDPETALEAIRASQTGHLVLSTMHCNDTTDAVQRLRDLHMHPNSIASELLAIFSQRLAKKNCDSCVAPAQPEPKLLAELFPDGPPADFVCFKGTGCPRCGGYGTRKRIECVEYLRVGPEFRRAISRNLPVEELRDVALASGLVTMRENALDLVRKGLIPMEELRFILSEERLRPERGGSPPRSCDCRTPAVAASPS